MAANKSTLIAYACAGFHVNIGHHEEICLANLFAQVMRKIRWRNVNVGEWELARDGWRTDMLL